MVLDYSERRPVSKNRPRKQPVGIFVFVLSGAVVASFSIGFFAGWLCFKPAAPKPGSGNPVNAAPVKQPNKESVPAVQLPPNRQDVPLTFYQTLPHGGKAVIGSGLNPKKSEENIIKKTSGQDSAAVRNTVSPVTAQPEEHPDRVAVPGTSNSTKPPESGTSRDNVKVKSSTSKPASCVQVVSTRDKKEAEAVKTRLAARGLAAYVVESKLQDRGVWYRVRIGRNLEPSEASELAAKAGKGAIVVTE